jgi:hypothetical protein
MQGGPRVKHLDDLPWNEVARIRFPDRTASIWEKWFELAPRFVCYYKKWDPGMICPRHGHHGDHAVFVVEGEIASGDLLCRAGSHIMLEYGDTFGPWTAGPPDRRAPSFTAGWPAAWGIPSPPTTKAGRACWRRRARRRSCCRRRSFRRGSAG